MNKTDSQNEKLTFTFIIKLCMVLGIGSGILLVPFMAIGYRLELDAIGMISLVILVPFINSLVMMLYAICGFWLYKYLTKRGKFGF